MIDATRLKDQFLHLIKIDSPSKHEAAIMHYLAQWFKTRGWKPAFDAAGKKIGGEVGNLIIKIKGNCPAAPTLLLNAHVDTVVTGVGVKPKIKAGTVYSNGKTALGADNKAGVAAILEVLDCLFTNAVPHGDLLVILTVAEETGLLGSRAMDITKINADFGFVLDGGKPQTIYNRAPSQNSISAKIIGRAAHAGAHPEKGISAILVASQAIAKMKLGRIDHETTANIGIIEGGSATNIVPEKVAIKGEARSHDLAKLKRQTAHMRQQLGLACQKNGAKLIFNSDTVYRAFKIGENSQIITVARMAAKKMGHKIKLQPTGGGSDANVFNAAGIPALIMGVGARQIHTNTEQIALRDLQLGANFLLQIILEAAKWTGYTKKL